MAKGWATGAGVRGAPQRRKPGAEPANPNDVVQLLVRVPAHLRTKIRTNAAVLGVSLSAYTEQVFADLPALQPTDQLPLSESA
jgi:hypothetical protein